mmetsp:Transcript_27795/g.83079  ORF Transcript_27795/g.83079 Transcript_27795/m.83079 type:complete len:229 (+) Transcript_27795:978-1664(+)
MAGEVAGRGRGARGRRTCPGRVSWDVSLGRGSRGGSRDLHTEPVCERGRHAEPSRAHDDSGEEREGRLLHARRLAAVQVERLEVGQLAHHALAQHLLDIEQRVLRLHLEPVRVHGGRAQLARHRLLAEVLGQPRAGELLHPPHELLLHIVERRHQAPVDRQRLCARHRAERARRHRADGVADLLLAHALHVLLELTHIGVDHHPLGLEHARHRGRRCLLCTGHMLRPL